MNGSQDEKIQDILQMIQVKSSALLTLGMLFGTTSEESLFKIPGIPLEIKIEGGGFGKPVRILEVKPQIEAAKKEPINIENMGKWIKYVENDLIECCEELELKLSRKHAQRILSLIQSGTGTLGEFSTMWGELGQRLIDELDDKISLQVEMKVAHLFGNEKALGDKAFDAFMSARGDVEEAATCLCLDRGTACVMHLGRVVEIGLRTLADELSLPQRPDWGRHLEDIERELTKRYKASGTRTEDELFYAEAAAQIGHIKTAWRNPSVHADKMYTPERAAEIFQAVKSFMAHLSTRLHEKVIP